MKSCRVDVSVFVPLSLLHLVPVEDPFLCRLFQPVRHCEEPPLMSQHSVSVARGAKALNCCLETLSGSLKNKPLKCSCAGLCNPVHI